MDNSIITQHNVVPMTEFHPNSGYAPLAVVEAYWDALRAGREMPKRAEIDPRGIESALEFAFILERVAPGVARLRIAGSHLHGLMGMEARGMPITAFFEQDRRLQVAGLLEEVFQTPGIATLTLQAAASPGQPELEARMILLPLKSDLGDVSRILGCLVSQGNHGDQGAVPRRFDIRSSHFRGLGCGLGSGLGGPDAQPRRAVRPVPLSEMPRPGHAAVMQTAGEIPASASGGGSCGGEKKRPAYLRLVKTDT